VAPAENDTTETKVPVHLPNIKPANKASGVPKPRSKIQIILKIEKRTKSKNVFFDLKSFNNC
jgi:hypothetical protein